jgi:hypothetical protein
MILAMFETSLCAVKLEAKIEWRDAWTGLHWDTKHFSGGHGLVVHDFHVYVCPLWFCLLHARFRRVEDAGAAAEKMVEDARFSTH